MTKTLMLVLTYFVMLVAVISAVATNAIIQQRLMAAGKGWLRNTAISGLAGMLAMAGVMTAYFLIGSMVVSFVG